MYRGFFNTIPELKIVDLFEMCTNHNNSKFIGIPFFDVFSSSGQRFKFCADTGSSTSYLRFDVARKFNATIDTSQKPRVTIANDTSIESLGKTEITINFANGKMEILQCIVVQNAPASCLVGMDFLYKFCLDLPNHKMVHSKDTYSVPLEYDLPSVEPTDFKIHKTGIRLRNNRRNYISNFTRPAVYDTTSNRILPIMPNGELDIKNPPDNYHDIEIQGPIFDCSDEFMMACTETLKNNDSLKQDFMQDSKQETTDFDKIDVNMELPANIRAQYWKLLREYKDLFIFKTEDIGKYAGPELYDIELTTEKPAKSATYPIPVHMQDNFREHMQKLLENGLIEPCYSTSYNHGMIGVKKKCGGTRWASDMRAINKITVDDAYNLPKIPNLLRHMMGNEVYSCLDIFLCFHQFPISENIRDKFGFECPLTGIRYRWTRCFFGLKNIPQHVSYIMNNTIFRGKDLNESSVFIDDITCYNKSHKSMLENLKDVFERIRYYNLKFKATKCKFGYTELNQFGFEVSKKGMKIDPKRAEKISLIEKPKTKKQLHTTIGAINYFRSVIPNFAKYTSVLTPLLSEKTEFIWEAEHDMAWNNMLKAVKSSILLNKPNFREKLIVTSDSSDLYNGGSLTQEIAGENKILAVYSSHIPKQCLHWQINIKELLGCVRMIERFEDDLLGAKFTLRTDSTWVYFLLKNARDVYYKKAGPVVRLLMRLSRFDFDVELHGGTSEPFKLADVMSRLNINPKKPVELSHKTVGDILYNIEESDLKIESEQNTCLAVLPNWYTRNQIREFVIEKQAANKQEIIRKYLGRKGFKLQDLTLDKKLIVPSTAINRVLEMVHHHHGVKRELNIIRNIDLKWDGMTVDLTNFVQSCSQCSRLRTQVRMPDIGIFPRAPNSCFESVAIDHLCIGQGSGSAIYVLVLMDHLSGFVLLEQVETLTLKDTLDQLVKWFLTFNITECSLKADNAFLKPKFIEMMNVLNVHARFSCPGNSRSNAEVERRMRMINEKFRVNSLHNVGQKNISLELSYVQAEINSTPLTGTIISPFEVVFGVTPKMHLIEPLKRQVVDNLEQYSGSQYERLLELSKSISVHYDQEASFRNVQIGGGLHKVGDFVRIRKPQVKGVTKWQYLPYSVDIYKVLEVRPATRSYVLELKILNRQPLHILCHHRRTKKVIMRLNRSNDQSQNEHHIDLEVEQENVQDQQNQQDQQDQQDDLQDNFQNVMENNILNEAEELPEGRAGRIRRKPAYLNDYES